MSFCSSCNAFRQARQVRDGRPGQVRGARPGGHAQQTRMPSRHAQPVGPNPLHPRPWRPAHHYQRIGGGALLQRHLQHIIVLQGPGPRGVPVLQAAAGSPAVTVAVGARPDQQHAQASHREKQAQGARHRTTRRWVPCWRTASLPRCRCCCCPRRSSSSSQVHRVQKEGIAQLQLPDGPGLRWRISSQRKGGERSPGAGFPSSGGKASAMGRAVGGHQAAGSCPRFVLSCSLHARCIPSPPPWPIHGAGPGAWRGGGPWENLKWLFL